MGRGGEIFVLDMGEPVRILDLARDMIQLSGLKPGEDIEITVTGVRPGEKLYEEVATHEEGVTQTAHPKIFRGRILPVSADTVSTALERLTALVNSANEGGIRDCLAGLILDSQLNRPVAGGADVVSMAERRKDRDSGQGAK
jgi:FlaA1/EpsC-like NDP-sugar epimerase